MLDEIKREEREGQEDGLESPVEEDEYSSYVEVVFGECFPDGVVFEIVAEHLEVDLVDQFEESGSGMHSVVSDSKSEKSPHSAQSSTFSSQFGIESIHRGTKSLDPSFLNWIHLLN